SEPVLAARAQQQPRAHAIHAPQRIIQVEEGHMSVAPAAPRQRADGPLVLDRRVLLIGTLIYDGEVHLAGRIEGEVRCRKLQVAERGSVEGDIVADRAVILGEVNGSIYANHLMLGTACTVEGDIYHRHL